MTNAATPARMLSNRQLIEIAAGAIEPLLNRLVFTGRHVADHLIAPASATTSRAIFAGDDILRVLSSASLDRVGADLQRLGLQRATRTAVSERWIVDDRVTLDLTHVAGDESAPDAIWLEYASLLTVAVESTHGPKHLSVRITGAPALLALYWAAYQAGGESPLDSGQLEDIIALVAGRAELARELLAAPPELNQFVAAETVRFLLYDGAEHVIRGALSSANRSAAMVTRVAERLRTIAG